MSELVRCDQCRAESKGAVDWLQLDHHGIDGRGYGNRLHMLPLHFCGISCLRDWTIAFVEDAQAKQSVPLWAKEG